MFNLSKDAFQRKDQAFQETLNKRREMEGVPESTERFRNLRASLRSFSSALPQVAGPRREPPRDILAYYSVTRQVVMRHMERWYEDDLSRKDEEVIRVCMLALSVFDLRRPRSCHIFVPFILRCGSGHDLLKHILFLEALRPPHEPTHSGAVHRGGRQVPQG